MGLEKLIIEHDTAWALWRIDEEEQATQNRMLPDEEVPLTITNPKKRLEWLVGRLLTKEVMLALNLPYRGIIKDAFGKPFPKECNYHLSLSHSFPYVAVRMDKFSSVGIDLEQPKEKLLRIAPRVLHSEEIKDAGSDITKHCIYWCAKETLIKVYGKKDLTLATNLFIEPFNMELEGDITGKIIIGASERIIPLQYIVNPNFVMVLSSLKFKI